MVSILVVEVSLNPNLKVSIFTRKGNVQVSMNFVSRVIFNFVLKIVWGTKKTPLDFNVKLNKNDIQDP